MEEERWALQEMPSRGKAAARKLMHARILLKADTAAGGSNMKVTNAPEAQRFVEEPYRPGFDRAAI